LGTLVCAKMNNKQGAGIEIGRGEAGPVWGKEFAQKRRCLKKKKTSHTFFLPNESAPGAGSTKNRNQLPEGGEHHGPCCPRRPKRGSRRGKKKKKRREINQTCETQSERSARPGGGKKVSTKRGQVGEASPLTQGSRP